MHPYIVTPAWKKIAHSDLRITIIENAYNKYGFYNFGDGIYYSDLYSQVDDSVPTMKLELENKYDTRLITLNLTAHCIITGSESGGMSYLNPGALYYDLDYEPYNKDGRNRDTPDEGFYNYISSDDNEPSQIVITPGKHYLFIKFVGPSDKDSCNIIIDVDKAVG